MSVAKTIGSVGSSASSSAYPGSSTPLRYDDASIFDAIGNHFTGNLDYKRQVESAARAEETSAREAAIAREFSASEAAKNRKWQEEMSNTAYSRAIADLKRNGINPYAIGIFQQASTPAPSLPTAFAGSGYVGSSAGNGGRGLSDLMDFVETAYKEQQTKRRYEFDIIKTLIGKLLGGSSS